MSEDSELNYLLRFAIQVVGRLAIPPETVSEIIGGRTKQIEAFNLCDGTRTLGEIVKETGINDGNLSRTVARWEANGILIRIGEGKGARLLHIYPISEMKTQKQKGRNAAKGK